MAPSASLLAVLLAPAAVPALRLADTGPPDAHKGVGALPFQVDNASAALGLCGPTARLRTSKLTSLYHWAGKTGGAASAKSVAGVPWRLHSPSWSYQETGDDLVTAHACIDDQRDIYLSQSNGMVYKFSSEGAMLWSSSPTNGAPLGYPGYSPGERLVERLVGGCALMDGSIYVGFADGRVESVSMRTGRQQWKVKYAASAGADSWSIAAHSGVLLVPGRSESVRRFTDRGGNDLLFALDYLDGGQLWKFTPDRDVYNFVGSFVTDPPSVIFSDVAGVVYRLRLCDGSVLWKSGKDALGKAETSPGGAVVEPESGLVYVASNTGVRGSMLGGVTAYKVETGELVWEYEAALPISGAPVVGRLGHGEERSVVVASGTSPGTPDRVAEFSGIYADGTRVAAESKVFALDPLNGQPTGWKYSPPVYTKPQAEGDEFPSHLCLPDAWSGGAIGPNGTLYIGHMSGNLYAIRDVDGDGRISEERGEVSRYNGGRCYRGSPGLAPGMLVATPCDGMHVFTGRAPF